MRCGSAAKSAVRQARYVGGSSASASAIVLLDDDVGAIVHAVRLGRRIYDNIRKAMAFIVAVHVPMAYQRNRTYVLVSAGALILGAVLGFGGG